MYKCTPVKVNYFKFMALSGFGKCILDLCVGEGRVDYTKPTRRSEVEKGDPFIVWQLRSELRNILSIGIEFFRSLILACPIRVLTDVLSGKLNFAYKQEFFDYWFLTWRGINTGCGYPSKIDSPTSESEVQIIIKGVSIHDSLQPGKQATYPEKA